MIHDLNLMFSDAVAITSTAISSVLDWEATKDFGPGAMNLAVFIKVDTLFTTGDAALLTIGLETDSAVGLDSTPKVLATSPGYLVAAMTKDTVLWPGLVLNVKDLEQYVGLRYTVTVGTFTAGKIKAGLVLAGTLQSNVA